MRLYLKKTGFVVVMTVIIVIISVLCIGITAISKSEITKQEQENYYREQEKEYVKELRVYLENIGYPNSGVTMTRTTESDGTVIYSVTIHHSRIGSLALNEREELLAQLASIPSPRDNAGICHKFLKTNY